MTPLAKQIFESLTDEGKVNFRKFQCFECSEIADLAKHAAGIDDCAFWPRPFNLPAPETFIEFTANSIAEGLSGRLGMAIYHVNDEVECKIYVSCAGNTKLVAEVRIFPGTERALSSNKDIGYLRYVEIAKHAILIINTPRMVLISERKSRKNKGVMTKLNVPLSSHREVKLNPFAVISSSIADSNGPVRPLHFVKGYYRTSSNNKFVLGHWRGSAAIGKIDHDYKLIRDKGVNYSPSSRAA